MIMAERILAWLGLCRKQEKEPKYCLRFMSKQKASSICPLYSPPPTEPPAQRLLQAYTQYNKRKKRGSPVMSKLFIKHAHPFPGATTMSSTVAWYSMGKVERISSNSASISICSALTRRPKGLMSSSSPAAASCGLLIDCDFLLFSRNDFLRLDAV